MDLLSLARKRVSIRRYKSSLKPRLEDIIYCIKVANEAPSGLNCQPWHFIIASSDYIKREVRRLCEERERFFHRNITGNFKKWLRERNITWVKKFLTDAPYLIIVISDMSCPFFIQSTWLSIGYFLLACEEKNLSTLTYTPPITTQLRELLAIPKGYRIEAIIPIGYKSGEKFKELRKPAEEKIFMNQWVYPK